MRATDVVPETCKAKTVRDQPSTSTSLRTTPHGTPASADISNEVILTEGLEEYTGDGSTLGGHWDMH